MLVERADYEIMRCTPRLSGRGFTCAVHAGTRSKTRAAAGGSAAELFCLSICGGKEYPNVSIAFSFEDVGEKVAVAYASLRGGSSQA